MEYPINPWVTLFRWISIALGLVILMVLLALLWTAIGGTDDSQADDKQGQTGLQIDALPDPASFSEVIERSLFSWNRKPKTSEASEETPEQSEVEATWQLAGLVEAGSATYAIFKDLDGQRRLRLEKGDELDGWTVESLDTEQVVLIKDGQRETYSLSVTEQQQVVKGEETVPETGASTTSDGQAEEEEQQ